MSFLFDKTQTLDTTPTDTRNLRGQLGSFLQEGLANGNTSILDLMNDPNFMRNVIEPFQASFAATRNRAIGQAKEGVGNLTGTGLGNVIGRAAGESALQENSFLAGLFRDTANDEANRFSNLLNTFANTGVGPSQNVVKKGLLGQLISAGGRVGTAIVSGGASEILPIAASAGTSVSGNTQARPRGFFGGR